MAGFIPDEGEQLIAEVIMKRISGDRDANLEMGLFTDAAPGETITEATINEPSGNGYARKALADASWSVANGIGSFAEQTFIAGVGGWTGSVVGYFIASISAGGTKRILFIEVDPGGPYAMTENDEYRVIPNVTITG